VFILDKLGNAQHAEQIYRPCRGYLHVNICPFRRGTLVWGSIYPVFSLFISTGINKPRSNQASVLSNELFDTRDTGSTGEYLLKMRLPTVMFAVRRLPSV